MPITITDTTPRVEYTVGGTPQSAFAIPFEYFDDSDIVAYQGTTLLVLTTDYTLVGGSGAAGTLTTVSPVSDDTITILSNMPIARTVNFPESNQFNIGSLNTEMAKHVKMMQQLERDIARSALLPTTVSDSVDVALPTPVASQVIGWDNPATSLTNYDTANFATVASFVNWNVETFTGDGADVDIVLTVDPGVSANVWIWIDGVFQHSASWTRSGLTITFDEAPANLANIEVRYGTTSGATPTIAAGAITPAMLADPFTLGAQTLDFSASTFSGFLPGGVDIGDPGLETSGININGVTYGNSFRVNDIGSGNPAEMVIHRHSTTLHPLIVFARTNDDTTSHTAVTSGQIMSEIYAAGYTGSHYDLFGSSRFSADTGTISATSSPGRWDLMLTPDGSNTPAAVITALNDKSITFAGTLVTSAGVTVNEGGNDSDTRVETQTSPQAIWADASEDRLRFLGNGVAATGIGSPGPFIQVQDSATTRGSVTIYNAALHTGTGYNGSLLGVRQDNASATGTAFHAQHDGSGKIIVGEGTSGEVFVVDNTGTTITNAFTSLGIDDNATTNAITISSDEEVTMPGTPSFQARTNTLSNVTGDGTAYTVLFPTERFDVGANFASPTYTAPVTGKYLHTLTIETRGLTGSHTDLNLAIVTSNRTYGMARLNPSAIAVSGIMVFNGTMYADMDAADTATISLTVSGGTKVVDIDEAYWSVALVH